MIEAVLAIAIGFLGHQTKHPIERRFGHGWSDLAKHAFGVGILYPVVWMIGRRIGMSRDELQRMTIAYWLGALGVGVGVGVGYTFEK